MTTFLKHSFTAHVSFEHPHPTIFHSEPHHVRPFSRPQSPNSTADAAHARASVRRHGDRLRQAHPGHAHDVRDRHVHPQTRSGQSRATFENHPLVVLHF